MQERAVHILTRTRAFPSAGRVGSPRHVDVARADAYLVCSTCSPLDQPKGLRRGFDFQGHLDAA
jgi:hypothetical protein